MNGLLIVDCRSLRPATYQPQQSVLYRQFGHRHTACIRNISVPQRSQITASFDGLFADGHDAGGVEAVGD
jgi:hypothetical protein